MKRRLLIRVFSKVNRLEADLGMSPADDPQSGTSDPLTLQQRIVVSRMRRTANLIQFALAKNNWPVAVRHLRVFRGHDSMASIKISKCSSSKRPIRRKLNMVRSAIH